MKINRTSFLVFVFCFLFVLFMFSKVNAITPSANHKVNVDVEFSEEMSGGNKFIFKLDVKGKFDGTIKEFFIEEGQKLIPVSTYEVSKNKYAIVVNHGKDFSINNVKLGVITVKNRVEQIIRDIATLNGKNSEFKVGQVLDSPMLLYHDQDKIMVAIKVHDPWDTLKNVKSIVVYPEIIKDFEVSFEKKYIPVGEDLKQFVYVTLKGFKEDQVLKFNINLLFQSGLKDVSLTGVNKVFFYNFDMSEIGKNLIKHVFTSLIKRGPTEVEISKYSKLLLSKSMSVSGFITSIVNSSEFKNIKIDDGEFLNRVYRAVLNREPDDDGKSYWTGEIKKSSRVSVLKQLFKNDEYVRTVKELGLNL